MATRSQGRMPAGKCMGPRGWPGREGTAALLRGEGWGRCRVAATVLEGLKPAFALLGSWPLGVPLPLCLSLRRLTTTGPFSVLISGVRGPRGGACAGPYLPGGAKARARAL